MATRQGKTPISAHPLFPAVVALWFAALFGLGSGVLPNVLFERVITATHLASLIPSATPPLGSTFRLLLSPCLALVGAVIGFVLARRLAAAHYVERPVSVVSQITPKPDPAPKKRAAADGQRRPISVKEELGDTRLDPFVAAEDDARSLPIPRRRRSLALAEDEPQGDAFAAVVPLPTDAPDAEVTEELPPLSPVDRPLDLTSFGEAEPEALEDPVHVSQAEPRIETESIVQRGLHGLRNRSPFAKPFGDEGEPPLDTVPAFAPLAEELPAQQAIADDTPLPFDPPQVAEPATETPPVFAAAAAQAAPILPTDPAADLSDLGMVQLAERLAASLRNRLSHPPASPAFLADLKADLGIETFPAQAAEDIAPGSAIFGEATFEPAPAPATPAMEIPAAMRPLSLELDEEDEFDDIGAAEENYSSLLAMKSPAHGQAEREHGETSGAIDARPFDGPPASEDQHPRANSEETQKALRSALATLQRVSGAA